MTRPTTRRAPIVHAALCALVSGACGDYVRYEPGALSGGTAARASLLDEATRAKLAVATHLDHLGLEAILGAFARPSADGVHIGLDWDGLAASDEAQLVLDEYLATLDASTVDALASPEERLAFWVNGYDAAVIRAVLDAWGGRHDYSVSEGGFIVFDRAVWSFSGHVLSLDQVEHGVLRGDEAHASIRGLDDAAKAELRALHAGVWGPAGTLDPRIHAVLNCASRSCPNLPGAAPYALRADRLEVQLDAAARAFAGNAEKGAGPRGVSRIFDWFATDFEGPYGNAAGFIRHHRDGGLDGVNLDTYLPYDWSLNLPR